MKNLLLFFLFILLISFCAFGQKADDLLVRAQTGDKEAQYKYARKLTSLHPGAADYQKAIIWLQKSAEQGYVNAQNELGYWFHMGYGVAKDQKKAFSWYKKAAEQGYDIAQYNVGLCYEYGRGVQQSESDAFLWYKKAAEKGYKSALYALGCCFYYAKGTSRDYQLAYEFFMKAAEQNHAQAMCNLGDIFYYGYGKSKDLLKAIEWYDKASDECNSSAEYKLAQMLLKGESVEIDSINAAELLLHSAGGGFLDPCNSAGSGTEFDKGNSGAEQLLMDLSNLDHSPLQHYFLALVGCLYFQKEEFKKAEMVFKKSIEKGSILSMTELGLMYFYIAANTPHLYYEEDSESRKNKNEDSNRKWLGLENYKYSNNSRCIEYANLKRWTDDDNIAYWLEKAIDYGMGSFEYGIRPYNVYDHLLFVYVDEVGGKRDLNKAIDVAYKCLLDTTCENAGFNAEMTLEIVGEQPELASKLYTTYLNLYNEIINQGIEDKKKIGLASEGLGRCYYNGTGVDRNCENAFNYFSIASKNGNNYATCELGEMYFDGIHVEKDYSKAFELFNMAATKSYGYEMTSNSMKQLSYCYRFGVGTTKDLEKADYWQKKAQEAGDEIANRINQILRNNK